MRVVLDTNVLVSALITRGTPPDRLYQAWLRNEVELVTSVVQVDEIADVLSRPKLRKYVDPAGLVSDILLRAIVIRDMPVPEPFPGPEGRRHSRHGRHWRSRPRGFRRQAGDSGAAGGRGNADPHPARSAANRARSVSHRVILTAPELHLAGRTSSPGAPHPGRRRFGFSDARGRRNVPYRFDEGVFLRTGSPGSAR